MMMRKMRDQRRAQRKRGAGSLFDAALAIGVLMAIIAMMAINNQRESQAQQDRLTAARMEIFTNVAKAYVGEQYDEIREQMISGNDATLVLTMADLADTGYASGSLVSASTADAFGQTYRLFIRGVLRSDASWPQATITPEQIALLNVPDMNGTPTLINRLFSPTDDEMDLEAVLLSEGGTPIPLRRGPNITANSGNPTMGYITGSEGALIASGNLGGFQLPLDPWVEMGAVPQSGGLASLISLSDGNFGAGSGSNIRGALRRCADLMTPGERDTCLADGNRMYSSIVFTSPVGSTPDFDQYPGIEGLRRIACRGNDSDARPVGSIDDSFDVIYVDCGNVVISDNLTLQGGDLVVDQGDISINNGTLTLNGNDISNNLIMASGEGANLELLPASPVTEICPLRADGTRMEYRVQAWVSNVIEPVGRPLAGYRMTQPDIDQDTGQFEVDVIGFVNEDYCENVNSTRTVLSPNNLNKDMNIDDFDGRVYYDRALGSRSDPAQRCGPVAGEDGNGDGYPDAYFLNRGQAQIQYAIYCE